MVCCWGCLSALQVAEMLAWMARKRGVRFFRRAATSTQMHARVHAVQTSLRMHMRNRRHFSYFFYFAVENRDFINWWA
jgi:hypothetical protein